MMKHNLLYLALACLLLLAASLGTGPEIGWYAITGGGGHYTAGIYTLDSAIGQPVAGVVAGIADPGYSLCAGFLCSTAATRSVYLPAVRK
jgi:hypothetical protein